MISYELKSDSASISLKSLPAVEDKSMHSPKVGGCPSPPDLVQGPAEEGLIYELDPFPRHTASSAGSFLTFYPQTESPLSKDACHASVLQQRLV